MDKVVHFEIPADSMERAQEFYSTVFGWQIVPMPEMKYTIVRSAAVDEQNMVKEPGAINGGMMTRQAPLSSPVITIAVAEIDAAMKKIMSAGGSLVREKFTVGDMGWAAYFKDTEGNILGLWQNRS